MDASSGKAVYKSPLNVLLGLGCLGYASAPLMAIRGNITYLTSC